MMAFVALTICAIARVMRDDPQNRKQVCHVSHSRGGARSSLVGWLHDDACEQLANSPAAGVRRYLDHHALHYRS